MQDLTVNITLICKSFLECVVVFRLIYMGHCGIVSLFYIYCNDKTYARPGCPD